MDNRLQIRLVACSPEQSPMAYPLGALCIQTALSTNEKLTGRVDVELTHVLADTHIPHKVAREIASLKPDVVAISLYLYNRPWFDTFLDELLLNDPTMRIFAGGPEAGAHAQELLRRGVFCVILGEGEESICHTVEQLLDGEQVSGPGIQTADALPTAPAYPRDLSNLRSPVLSGVAKPSDYEGVLWEMTRGCPYQCTFCFESRGHRSVRTYPVERLAAELDLFIRHQVSHVFVLDPTFNMNRQRTIEMLTLLQQRAPSSMHFTFEVRAELLDDETALLFGSFLCSLQIGLQSSDRQVLKSIGRRFDPDVFYRKISLLNTYGVVFGLDLIIGLPGDTESTFSASLDYAISCRPSNLDIFVLAILPGTQLALDADALGLRYQHDSPYLLLESPTMSAEAIGRAVRLKQACDTLYTRGRAVMWFQTACNALECRPSTLFSRFADYTEEHDIDDQGDIYTIQDQFIRHQFTVEDKAHLLPAMLSFLELHQGISFLQDTGENPHVYLHYPPDSLALLDTVPVASFVAEHEAFDEPVEHLVFYQDDILFVEPVGYA